MVTAVNNNLAPTLEQYRRLRSSEVNKTSEIHTPRYDAVELKKQPNKNQIEPNKTKRLLTSIGAVIVGLIAPAYVLYDELHKVSVSEAKDEANSMRNILPEVDNFEHTKEVAQKVLEDSGLKSKGVKLHFLDGSKESEDCLRESLEKNIPKNSLLYRRIKNNYFNIFNEGGNAVFLPGTNEIFVSSEGIHDMVYHELGHAMNINNGATTRLLQKCRNIAPFGVSVIAPLALLTAVLHKTDKTKPNSQKDIKEKSLDFVSNHPAGLTLASYLPILAEEGLASIRGLKYASKYLEPEKITKIGRNCLTAFSTYLIAAGMVSAGVYIGNELSKGNYLAGQRSVRQKD